MLCKVIKQESLWLIKERPFQTRIKLAIHASAELTTFISVGQPDGRPCPSKNMYQRCQGKMLIRSIHWTDHSLYNSRAQSLSRNAKSISEFSLSGSWLRHNMLYMELCSIWFDISHWSEFWTSRWFPIALHVVTNWHFPASKKAGIKLL